MAPLRLMCLLALLILAAPWPGAVAAQPADPGGRAAVAGALRLVPTAEGLTVRLALSAPLATPPRAFALDEPMRWAIDLDQASSLRREVEGRGEARGARVSQFDPRTVRIVVDLARPMRLAEAFQADDQTLELRFRPVDAAGFRREVARGRAPIAGFAQARARAVPPGPEPPPDLAADVSRRLDAVEAAVAEAERRLAAPPEAVPEATGPPPRAEPVATARGPARRPGRRVVVLDAGHGGHDPGAPSAIGGHEKEVTLAIARAARAAIERRASRAGVPVTVRLTRDDDRFLTLGERVRLARQWGADLFISIHADSAPNAEARGATVYTLSDVASDREAARLAQRENRADLIAGIDLSGERADAAAILVDLGLRDGMNRSADFAQALQRAMEPKGVPFRQNFHRFAGFQVLRNLGVTAVLLETGYMSNAEDSRYLFSRAGQQAVADGIADAVVGWFAGPPSGGGR
ncbi:MAG: N-acetylmuramoyl-L-alanine amidase [Sphingomonadaceae bacterium]